MKFPLQISVIVELLYPFKKWDENATRCKRRQKIKYFIYSPGGENGNSRGTVTDEEMPNRGVEGDSEVTVVDGRNIREVREFLAGEEEENEIIRDLADMNLELFCKVSCICMFCNSNQG